MPDETPRVLAEFSTCSGLHAALRQAREARNVSLDTMDRIAGTSDRYFAKVLAPNSERKLSMQSLEWALGALGVRCLIVDDPVALERINGRMIARNNNVVRTGAVTFTRVISLRFLRKIARKGGLATNQKRSEQQRSAIAKHAASARWHGRSNGR